MAKINYEALEPRTCVYCKEEYKPTGPAQTTCSSCKKKIDNLDQQVSRDIARYEKFGTYERLGKGYSQSRGKNHHSYKNGLGSYFPKYRKEIKEEMRYCQSCGKDLIDAGRYHWCVHHIDHNRDNNEKSNLTLLCKRCHQIEHDCINALRESATTIREE